MRLLRGKSLPAEMNVWAWLLQKGLSVGAPLGEGLAATAATPPGLLTGVCVAKWVAFAGVLFTLGCEVHTLYDASKVKMLKPAAEEETAKENEPQKAPEEEPPRFEDEDAGGAKADKAKGRILP